MKCKAQNNFKTDLFYGLFFLRVNRIESRERLSGRKRLPEMRGENAD